jgi:dual specificity tyrosine-phosphorylation-regulated kinase 2/3/4
LTEYEKAEIFDYKQVYYLGLEAKKIKGNNSLPHNNGYDDDRGDYNVVMKDHVGFRFEVLGFLGKGSFG